MLTCAVTSNLHHHWRLDITNYLQRLRWSKHNKLWSDGETDHYTRLMNAIRKLSLDDQVPLALPHELADPHGRVVYRARYHHWFTEWRKKINKAQQAVAPYLAELDRLLPCPSPASPPTGHRTAHQALVPDPPSERELLRVQTCLGPRSQCTMHTNTITLDLLLRRRRGSTAVELARDACNLFSAPPSAFVSYALAASGCYPPDSLGLDPLFWRRIGFKRDHLTLSIHTFQIHA